MKKPPDVLEWISKAEQDYQTAITMARKRKKPYQISSVSTVNNV